MKKTEYWKNLIIFACFSLLHDATSEQTSVALGLDHDLTIESWSLLQDEVKNLVSSIKTCRESVYSCSGSMLRRSCSCYENCMDYADCCAEKVYSKLSDGDDISRHNFSCVSFEKGDDAKGSIMIRGCKESFYRSNLEDLCHKEVPLEFHDHSYDIPAISFATNLTYQNYFCAACNNDTHNLVPLTMTVKCIETKNERNRDVDLDAALKMNISEIISIAEYIPNSLEWKIHNASAIFELPSIQSITCKLMIQEFGFSKKLVDKYEKRICHINEQESQNKHLVKTCNEKWSNKEDISKCSHYSLKITNKNTSISYKNPHCAICNSVNISSPEIECALPMHQRRKFYSPSVPSISILFNINYKNGLCRSGHYWDRIVNRCKAVECGSSFQKIDGKCLPRNARSIPTSSNTKCSEVHINNETYILLINDTMKNGSLYDYTQFDVNGAPNVICQVEPRHKTMPVDKSSNEWYILLLISETCLAIHMILFCAQPKKQSWNSRNLMCLSVSLFFAQLIFMFGLTAIDNYYFCYFNSICLHFFWLASFFWMNILSIDVFKTFRSQTGVLSGAKFKTFIHYNIYGWGVPFIIVSSSVLVHSLDILNVISPDYVEHNYQKLCWINKPGGLITFFIAPVAIVVVANYILFVVTCWEIFKQYQNTKFARSSASSGQKYSENAANKKKLQIKQQRSNNIRVAVYIKLGILQGVTWSLIFLTTFIESSVLRNLFSLCNSLQGALIFICFDLKSMWVKSAWHRFSNRSQFSKKSSSSGSTKTTYSSQVMKSELRVK